MRDTYKDTKTWKNSLGQAGATAAETEILGNLTASYENAREKAAILADEIKRALPFFTVHDIDHIDALWDAADTLLYGNQDSGWQYPLNPAEGYVLGLSFLLHDLGMGLAAYGEGLPGLQKNQYFLDAVADAFRQEEDRFITEEDWKPIHAKLSEAKDLNDLPSFLKRALENTLRELHAQKAETLGIACWDGPNGKIYMIADDYLRDSYGKLAGEIAASHGWDYDTLKERFPDSPSGAPGKIPRKWTIDARKLACILRAADAIQIDDRRAPSLLMAIRKPEGVSKLHYAFQNKLNQPIVTEERLKFSSNSAFGLEEMDAWWVCYDYLRMVDRELRDADIFLTETRRTPFQARGVYGLSSPRELSRYIQAESWIPMDTAIQVGDMGKLVSTLGGKQLYGQDSDWVPFRELIQNGADAIRARRLQTKNWKDSDGDLTISLYEEGGSNYISFTDTGVGMSEAVLTGPFLDFGQSFWNTPLMHKEWPGLAAKGFQSTGQYGIGFYSVFMWSQDVKVVTRKYKGVGSDKTLTLEFREGVKCRPVLREATEEEMELVERGGTCVAIRISDELMEKIREGRIFKTEFERQYILTEETIEDTIAMFFPCLDCSLWINCFGDHKQITAANDWETLDPIPLIKRLIGPKRIEMEQNLIIAPSDLFKYADNLENIYENGILIGRTFLCPNSYGWNGPGCVIVGGIRGENLPDYVCGVIQGKSTRADRSQADLGMNKKTIQNWMKSQAEKLSKTDTAPDEEMVLSAILYAFSINTYRDRFIIARFNDEYLKYQDIVERVRRTEIEVLLIYPVWWDADVEKGRKKRKEKYGETIAFVEIYDRLSAEWINLFGIPEDTSNPYGLVKCAILEGLGISTEKEKLHVIDSDRIHDVDGSSPLQPLLIDLLAFTHQRFSCIITREELQFKGES